MNFALKLSQAFGPSSGENEVIELIKNELKNYNIRFKKDNLGSLIAIKEGKIIKNHGIILTAHSDEVGFIISKINEDGTLSFRKLGGIDDRLLPAKHILIGKNKIPGIIMSPPIHLAKDPYRAISYEDLRIFIGVNSENEAKKLVEVGDLATFDTQSFEKDDTLWGKAFDDRIGCYVLTEILKMDWDITISGIFSTQEEVGIRGVQSALHYVHGEFGFALEGTTSYDLEQEFPEESPSTILGKGPAITFMDRLSIGTNSLKKIIEYTAKNKKIPFQYKQTPTGGTETYFLMNEKAIPAVCISVPVHYIHAPLGFCYKQDVKNTIRLLKEVILQIDLQMKKIYGGK